MSQLAIFEERARSIVGDNGMITQADEVEPYLIDFWHQHRGNSPLVVRPATTDEVADIVRLAAEERIAIVPQGGNTGLVRGGIPDQTGNQIVLSLSRMTRVRHVDPAGDHLVAEAGCVLADIHHAATDIDRMFPLSLGSEGSCRIGGNISTNAGGVNVLRYGMTRHLVLGLEVVLGDGRIWNGLRPLRKDNTGYDLKQLFIGAEGSLGIIAAAALSLYPQPREVQTIWLGIESPEVALQLLGEFQAAFGETISSFELLTRCGVDAAARYLPGVRSPLAGSHPWHLLIEVAWSFREGLAGHVENLLMDLAERGLVEDGTIAQSEEQRAMMWRIREGQSEATRHMGYIIRSDISVRVGDIPKLIGEAQEHFGARQPDVELIPFGHVGDGNLHFNFLAPEDADEVARLRPLLLGDLMELVAAHDGSFSAEHGIGRMKTAELRRRRSSLELDMMRQLKTAFDPHNILNPGVILDDA